MVSVVTVVLFVTGWGSAVASSVTGVLVRNPVTNPVNVKETGTVTVGGSVGVNNLPAAPTTQVITHGSGHVNDALPYTLISPSTDLRAYRSVTVYVTFSEAQDPGQACQILTYDPDGSTYYQLASFFTGTNTDVSKTLDPAPPNMEFFCTDNTLQPFDYHFMLTGRTG
jgi:hypothetical protein